MGGARRGCPCRACVNQAVSPLDSRNCHPNLGLSHPYNDGPAPARPWPRPSPRGGGGGPRAGARMERVSPPQALVPGAQKSLPHRGCRPVGARSEPCVRPAGWLRWAEWLLERRPWAELGPGTEAAHTQVWSPGRTEWERRGGKKGPPLFPPTETSIRGPTLASQPTSVFKRRKVRDIHSVSRCS